MPITIDEPQLEALIHERMSSGRFETVNEMLLDALDRPVINGGRGFSGRDLIRVMQAMPYADEVDFEAG